MKTNSGLAEDRLSDIYSGVDSRRQSKTLSLPTRPSAHQIDSDNSETENGFRISRHLVGADNRYWDVNKYHTIQKLSKKDNQTQLMPNDKYSDIDDNDRQYDRARQRNSRKTNYNKNANTSNTNSKQRPRPFQVHDNERYYNHVFSLKPQRSLAKNIYSNEYFQPNSLDRAEI